jgi:hypothetical protein
MLGRSTRRAQDYPAPSADFERVRILEAAFILVIMLAVLIGGRSWIVDVAQFHGVAIVVLGIIGVFLIYAFRRSFLIGGPLARLSATRDAAFLAAIASAIAFIASPARWSLGATVVAIEFALIVELMARFTPAPP